jgi:hypothetical protein
MESREAIHGTNVSKSQVTGINDASCMLTSLPVLDVYNSEHLIFVPHSVIEALESNVKN